MITRLFTSNCSGLLAFTLGVMLTSAPKLVPQQAGSPSKGGFILQNFLCKHDSE